MPATTPILSLPYPLGTDRVMDGDNDIQALATRLEVMRPPKTVMAPAVGVGFQEAEAACVWQLPGGSAILQMFCSALQPLAANQVVGTVPANLRPAIRTFGMFGGLSPSFTFMPFEISTGGSVITNAPIAAGVIWGGSMAYVLGAAAAADAADDQADDATTTDEPVTGAGTQYAFVLTPEARNQQWPPEAKPADTTGEEDTDE